MEVKVSGLNILQPFASYRLAFRRKQGLKSYNYIVCSLKLFVLTLKIPVGRTKIFNFDICNQTILAFKIRRFACITESFYRCMRIRKFRLTQQFLPYLQATITEYPRIAKRHFYIIAHDCLKIHC